ncbi:hypothetical protein D2E76_19185 [Mycobacteroides abscessus]|uniref:Uncharacterized protein n=1 Tax=Mycobacteroides abscessus TaxID=36809 RepID=A0ABD7HL21_9MYCO|nr:hypothetical protein DDJ71_10385 [Mycobacteroides abscessus]RIR46834.1 hypothetical protein D2E39_01300 [Mycobacteroides abscessus]RIT35124.1 hypothetical protein D2E76_19185 [Mycobacteroides abscessus]
MLDMSVDFGRLNDPERTTFQKFNAVWPFNVWPIRYLNDAHMVKNGHLLFLPTGLITVNLDTSEQGWCRNADLQKTRY